jgi:hypothetical protein
MGSKDLHGKALETYRRFTLGLFASLSLPLRLRFEPIGQGGCHVLLAITYRAVADLKPYARNARTHSRKQVKQIAAAIKEFGFTNPVLIDESDQIIAGHGRVAAAKLLGLAEVPTLQLSHLSPTQKRAYILADNRLAEKAGWDKEILAVELQGLLDDGFEVILTGFEVPEVDVVLDRAAEARADRLGDDDIPGDGPAVSRSGDLWRLGNHRLLCGNALDSGSYLTLLGGVKASLVIGMGSFYRSKHELVFVWKSGTAPHLNNFELGQHGRNRTNVWDYAGVNSFRSERMDELQMHPTVTPVALVADAIRDCSRQRDTVLDPFCGSGTILIAAERTGRKARALEIDPVYVDVAIRRWEALTGNVSARVSLAIRRPSSSASRCRLAGACEGILQKAR